ncbi:hypothetical protein KXV70_007612 [Aspergillus fumigatus]|nr:hypothetical protein KXX48_009131 [Aspergillus fumigatus]KAH1364326.1 hypothetical protein KXX63_004984 [Aspergillus fumigatus]KAH1507438.1 hypothetical protein KXX52_006456 [Aspergillus fumigatus]KAH1777935.1 hypothetical protein KXX07_005183 [Aspergillus fumigatus]KAH1851239.1 hypothetical protein KXX43_001354 [Aspergillus fumigatus]
MEAVIVASGLCVAYAVYYVYSDALAEVPGPRFAKICPSWLIRVLWSNKLNQGIREQHQKHGDVVRLGPSELSFCSLSAHDTIYNTNSTSFITYGSFQSAVEGLCPPGVTFVSHHSPAEQKELRRVFQTAIRLAVAGGMEAHHKRRFSELVAGLNIKPGVPICVNLTGLLERLEWDLIGDLGLGYSVPDRLKDNWNSQKTHQNLIGVAFALGSFLLSRRGLKMLVDSFGPFWIPKYLDPAHLIDVALKQRAEGKSTFVSQAIPYKNEKYPHLTKQMSSNVTGLIYAAFETSESSTRAILCALMRDPVRYRNLQQEIRSKFSASKPITDSQLVGLPYLTACINEGLRLWPGLNGQFTSRVSTGAVVDGVYVPPGCLVSADLYTLQRHPRYWHDPDTFKPERWLDPKNPDEMRAFRPFSAGPRSCPGRQIALQKLRLTLAKFMFLFDMQFVNPQFEWDRDVPSGLLWSSVEVMVRMTLLEPPVEPVEAVETAEAVEA